MRPDKAQRVAFMLGVKGFAPDCIGISESGEQVNVLIKSLDDDAMLRLLLVSAAGNVSITVARALNPELLKVVLI